MTPSDAEEQEQLIRLASDDARIYQDAQRWFLSRGEAIAPALMKGLDDPRLGSVGHWRMLLLLRELALPSTLPAILKAFRAALQQNNPIVLPGAMEALAVFDADEALSALISVLDSADPDSVNHAAALLGKKGAPRAEAALTRLLGHRDPKYRQSAVRGLLEMQTDSAREKLREHRKQEQDAGVLKLLERLR